MNKSSLTLVGIVVLIVVAVVGLAFWLQSVSPEKTEADPTIVGETIFVRDNSHMTGSKDAKVTLVEFADYQCPACAAAFPTVKQIVEAYKDNPDFNFVSRNFPLPQFSNAYVSAQAAEAAAAQGKFQEMAELIYTNQSQWSGSINPTNTFIGYAQQLGLDVEKFTNEVKASQYINRITQDLRDGEALGVNSTPTFFLNGQRASLSEIPGQIAALLGE